MKWFVYEEIENDDRSHQDNFEFSDIDGQRWDNGSYQYCEFCGRNKRFEYDRCTDCGNN